MSNIPMSHATHVNESLYMYHYKCISIHIISLWLLHVQSYPSFVYSTGWRRLIGSPKLQIIFHKRATKYRSLLRKMTYKDKGSYESWPPCIPHSCKECISRGKFSTHLTPLQKVRQVPYTTRCQKFGMINWYSIGISTVPGGTIRTKIFSSNQKGTWYKYKFASKRSLESWKHSLEPSF